MRAFIMSTGDEVFLGEVEEKNGGFIAKELISRGIDVIARAVVEDNLEKILGVLDFGLKSAELVIITGGLGPTHDDLTREIGRAHV